MEENAKVWAERSACAGFDGASDQHDRVVVDRHGTVLHSFRIDDTADGWAPLRQRWSPYADLAITVETNCGAQDDQPVKCYEEPTNENPKNAPANRENISGRRTEGRRRLKPGLPSYFFSVPQLVSAGLRRRLKRYRAIKEVSCFRDGH